MFIRAKIIPNISLKISRKIVPNINQIIKLRRDIQEILFLTKKDIKSAKLYLDFVMCSALRHLYFQIKS